MDVMTEAEQQVLSVEFFAAKDSGDLMMMSVPWKCGLKDADTLRIKDLIMVAMRDKSVLPVDLPALSEEFKARLVRFVSRGKPLPVGEFSALGLVDGYFLNVIVA